MADSNPSIINVLIVIDADTILSRYPVGTPEQPTMVDQELIYMMVREASGDFGEGSKELKLLARTGDTIRWRESTLSQNSDYFAMLYDFFALKGEGLISRPAPLSATVMAPLPDPSAPLHVATQAVQTYFWECTALNPGEVTYAFRFAVFDRTGAIRGYFAWDPFIKISD